MESEDKGLLKRAAVSIGSAAGKIAASVGVGHQGEPAAKRSHADKLAKKKKSRLPRKQKKALAKKTRAEGRG